MPTELVFEKITNLLRDLLDDENLIVLKSDSKNSLKEWDSFTHINLMMALEKEFQIKIPPKEIIALNTIQKIIDFVVNNTL